MPIERMEIFKRYVDISDEIWQLCTNWSAFAQRTVGEQLCRAIDSVGANLVEGDGRYSKADALRFFIIARGSAREALYWLTRAEARGLLDLTGSP